VIIKFLRKVNKGRIRRAFRWYRYVLYKIVILARVSKYGLNSDSSSSKKVIVSLTSFPLRLENLHLCIKSLLQQTYKPHKIILWLGSDVSNNDVPESLLKMQQYGLDIRFKSEDLGSHKKYFYAMQEFPEDIIITVDDDYLYDKNLIKDLMNMYAKHNTSICTLIGWRMIWNKDSGELLERREWRYVKNILKAPSKELYIMGSYTLYPPNSLDVRVFDIENIRRLCTNTENGIVGYDDSWLKCMATLNSTTIVNARMYSKFFEIPEIFDSQELSLGGVCLADNYEGIVAQKIFSYYNLTSKNFKD
jgi:hypothetical protein